MLIILLALIALFLFSLVWDSTMRDIRNGQAETKAFLESEHYKNKPKSEKQFEMKLALGFVSIVVGLPLLWIYFR